MEQALDRLKEQCQEELGKSPLGQGKRIVFGEGNPHARIVLIGEAPGEREAEQGRPFVGQAGKNLDYFLSVLQLARDAIYITNTVKFRPVKVNKDTGREANRPPTREEIALCKPFLEREISLLAPEVIVTLGNIPLRTVLGNEKASIGQLHGVVKKISFAGTECALFPLYHPASIIYRRELQKTYEEDLQKLKDYLEVIHR